MASKSSALISSPLAKAAPKIEDRRFAPKIVADSSAPPRIAAYSTPIRPLGSSPATTAHPSESRRIRLDSWTTSAGSSVNVVLVTNLASCSAIDSCMDIP